LQGLGIGISSLLFLKALLMAFFVSLSLSQLTRLGWRFLGGAGALDEWIGQQLKANKNSMTRIVWALFLPRPCLDLLIRGFSLL
jgi:hypothetical protein